MYIDNVCINMCVGTHTHTQNKQVIRVFLSSRALGPVLGSQPVGANTADFNMNALMSTHPSTLLS